jgi:hypothetical protein
MTALIMANVGIFLSIIKSKGRVMIEATMNGNMAAIKS